MTADSLNIANGNANALVLKHQGKNLVNISSQRVNQSTIAKDESGISRVNISSSQKSIFEVNKSQTPLNKPIESSTDTLKSMLYSNISHKSKTLPDVNYSNELVNGTDLSSVNSGVENPALIEQSGWFITIVPDKKTNGGFLELTEKRDDHKKNLKEFYNPIVNFNKGKLLDLVG